VKRMLRGFCQYCAQGLVSRSSPALWICDQVDTAKAVLVEQTIRRYCRISFPLETLNLTIRDLDHPTAVLNRGVRPFRKMFARIELIDLAARYDRMDPGTKRAVCTELENVERQHETRFQLFNELEGTLPKRMFISNCPLRRPMLPL